MRYLIIILLLSACTQKSEVASWMGEMSNEQIDYSWVRLKTKNTESEMDK
jgi:Tfp pilus assembly protein PilP